MQQDNDPKHRSKSTTEWLQQKKTRLLEWPSQSPDLNLIEMLWHDLKRTIHTRHPKNVAELKQVCKEEWSKIPPDRCAGLLLNYRKSLVEVIAVKPRVNQLLNPRVHILFPLCTVNVYTVCSKRIIVCVLLVKADCVCLLF
jgi:hypothetical protein